MTYRSPTLSAPGAVPPGPESPDQGVPWHFGDPHGEQRALARGAAAVDLSHLGVLAVTGADRLSWLHSLSSANLLELPVGGSATTLFLDPNGRVEREVHVVDDGTTAWLITEPGSLRPLADYLDRMRFMLDVSVADATAERAVVWRPQRLPDPVHPTWLVPAEFAGVGETPAGSDRGGDASKYVSDRPGALVGAQVLVPREELADYLGAHGDPAGTWALEALRVAAGVPRGGMETDHKTIPHEVGWIGPAVHLAKGCYRGQETVARVHNMGRPPRRLVLLHIDGSDGGLPSHGDAVELDGRVVGLVGTAARHYELGPIATAIVKRSTPDDAVVTVGGTSATVQAVVDA
ncbi:MAG: folate-binding protein YgfZ [Actinobacteria bacterium]|nr:folate-binding protein YgfZ [Actinomycetota bacterium]